MSFLFFRYAASEKPLDGITSEALVKEMKAKGKNVQTLSSLKEMEPVLKAHQKSGQIFLTLGAGSISKTIREMVKTL